MDKPKDNSNKMRSSKTSKTKETKPRKLVNRRLALPSGCYSVWKLWRHCMCRNGFYPLIVAPFVTAAWILDVYTSLGCDFIHVDVGMEPINIAWNQTLMDLGLFHHRSSLPIDLNMRAYDSGGPDGFIMNAIHPECVPYESVFNEYFIEGDKTWQMAQIMAMVSGCAGAVATATIWLMTITPLPSCFFWPGILLPSSLMMLLAGTAQFLFFDTEVCRSALWVPQGDIPTAQRVESCTLSTDSIMSIVASAISLLCVLLICLRAPERRKLDETYGMRYLDINDDTENLRSRTMEDSTCASPTFEDLEMQKSTSWNQSPPPITTKASKDSSKDSSKGSLKGSLKGSSKEDKDNNRAYDLDTICHHKTTTGSTTTASSSSDTNKRSSARKRGGKRSSKNKSSDAHWEAEQMRAVEASMDHPDTHLESVWKEGSGSGSSGSGSSSSSRSLNNDANYHRTSSKSYHHHHHQDTGIENRPPSSLQKDGNYQNAPTNNHNNNNMPHHAEMTKQKSSSLFSPGAPSDEAAFSFRSPLKAFKDNFVSPQKVATSSSNSSSSNFLSSSSSLVTKKKNKISASEPKQEKKFDENIIDKCLNDLEHSFSN